MQQLTGFSRSELTSSSRDHMLCFARYCVWNAMKGSGLSYPCIGKVFGRNHSTIIHGIREVEKAESNTTYRRERKLWEDYSEKIKEENITETNGKIMLHDIEKLTGRARDVERLARIQTNIVFVLADCLERALVECEETNREAGYQLRQDCKRYYKAALHNITRFRSATRELDEDAQFAIGDDADLMYDYIYTTVSRTGQDNIMLRKFHEHIKSFPDLLGLDYVRKGSESFKTGNTHNEPTNKLD